MDNSITFYLRQPFGKLAVSAICAIVLVVLIKIHQYKPMPWAFISYALITGFFLGHIFWP